MIICMSNRKKALEDKLKFSADKMSGLDGSIFGITFFLEVIKTYNTRHIFKFPFYSLTINAKNNKAEEWVREDKYEKESLKIVEYVKKNGLSYFRKIEKLMFAEKDEFKRYVLELLPRISKFSDEQLVGEFSDFVCKYFHCFALGCITFLYEGILSEKLTASLSQRNYPVTEILERRLKTSYKSFLFESEKLLFAIKREKQINRKENLIQSYIRNYFFMDTSYSESPIMDKSAVQKKLKHLEGFVRDSVLTKHKPSEPQVEVKLNQNEKLMIELLKSAELVRDQRKQVAMMGVYVMIRFLDEAVKRRELDRSVAERAFWYEFSDLLFLPKKIIPILKKRKTASIVLNENNIFYLDYDAIQPRNKLKGKVKTIKGTPAAKGIKTGIVRIILGKKDFHKLKKGEILVTEMTRPDFMPILKLAGAIVTDEGGLTSHAAIVAREMGIPCIVGTKTATRILRSGDMIEANADKGVIKIIKRVK